MKIILAVGGGLLLVGMIVAYVSGNTPATPSAAVVPPIGGETAPSPKVYTRTDPPDPPMVPNNTQIGGTPRTALAEQLLNAPNYRKFVSEALNQPKSGGYYYATEAYFHCLQFQTAARVYGSLLNADLSPARKQAAEIVLSTVARCEGLDEQFAGNGGVLSMAVRTVPGEGIPDPLVRLGTAYLGKKVAVSSAKEGFKSAKQTGSVRLVAQFLQTEEAPYLFLLPGFDASRESDRSLFRVAALIVGCELAGDCTVGSLAVTQCLASSRCTSVDLRQQLLAAAPSGDRAKVQELVANLRRELK